MSHKEELLAKIANRKAKIAVVGVGYVGLPLVVEFGRQGFHVIALDLSERKVASINRGESYIEDIPTEQLRPLVEQGLINATTRYADLSAADAIIICVPTPLNKTKDPDMSYILQAITALSEVVAPGMAIILESTTYPGTTQEVIVPALTERGLIVGEDVFVAFSPERIDPGNKVYQLHNTPKVVGGVTPHCMEVVQALYSTAVQMVVPVSSPMAAEMVKLLENTFRAVNIALVNELALMCDRLGVDAWEVINAAATKPFGFMPFYPGPGLGGHCIPVDPHYLSWKLKTLNYNARFINLASEINTSMPVYVVEKVASGLNDDAKSVRNARVVVLGVAYKPNIDDVRESPALDIINLLRHRGADVVYHDPYIPQITLEDDLKMCSVEYTTTLLQEADCVVIVTHHQAYNWPEVVANSRLIVDTRHVTQPAAGGARIVTI
ncbi:nucleotide sugar dehydrogenase [Aggregatilineales bacterium SYSU G02658]